MFFVKALFLQQSYNWYCSSCLKSAQLRLMKKVKAAKNRAKNSYKIFSNRQVNFDIAHKLICIAFSQ